MTFINLCPHLSLVRGDRDVFDVSTGSNLHLIPTSGTPHIHVPDGGKEGVTVRYPFLPLDQPGIGCNIGHLVVVFDQVVTLNPDLISLEHPGLSFLNVEGFPRQQLRDRYATVHKPPDAGPGGVDCYSRNR